MFVGHCVDDRFGVGIDSMDRVLLSLTVDVDIRAVLLRAGVVLDFSPSLRFAVHFGSVDVSYA